MTLKPLSDEDQLIEPFDRAFDMIREAIQAAVDKFNAAVRAVYDKRFMLAPVLHWIKEDLEKVRAALDRLVKLVTYALEHQTPVVSLIRQSFDWIKQVKTPMSNLSSPAGQPRDQNLAHWTGAAANAYREKARMQRAAIDEVAGKAEKISKWLFTIAQANVDYVVELAKVVAGLLGKLAQAAVDAVTVIDIPFAVDVLAGEVGTLVEAGINNLLTICQRFVDALGNAREVMSEEGDRTNLPGGAWPQAVTG